MSARGLLVDTAFVQALFNRSDQYHDRARRWSQYLRAAGAAAQWWTTEAILIEIGNAFSASNRHAAADFIRDAYRSPTIRVVPVDTSLVSRAVQLYAARPDKTWGMTDCISFVVMQDHGLIDALTPDHHFEQAGFFALLRRDPP
jgi:predicted nucleic acid-binding protein